MKHGKHVANAKALVLPRGGGHGQMPFDETGTLEIVDISIEAAAGRQRSVRDYLRPGQSRPGPGQDGHDLLVDYGIVFSRSMVRPTKSVMVIARYLAKTVPRNCIFGQI